MRGWVASTDDGLLVIERRFSAGGRYDSLGAPKLAGDYGTIEVVEGGWVLRRTYHRADGRLIGELFNVQTPVEFSPSPTPTPSPSREPGVVRYTDLEVDVVRWPDGRVRVVDEDDLWAAVRAGGITPALAEQALTIAYRLADVLRAGGDWRGVGPPDPAGPAT